MLIHKITTGFVVQVFDTDKGNFISQNFVAGDECDYETPMGEAVDSDLVELTNNPYLPFDMVQPS